jgi:hypothetical protein
VTQLTTTCPRLNTTELQSDLYKSRISTAAGAEGSVVDAPDFGYFPYPLGETAGDPPVETGDGIADATTGADVPPTIEVWTGVAPAAAAPAEVTPAVKPAKGAG